MDLRYTPLPPFKERLTRALSYWSLALSGVWLVSCPPDSVDDQIGPVVLYTWAAMMLPGLVAGAFILRGKIVEEYVALCFVAGGVAFYSSYLWVLVPGKPSLGFVALLTTGLAIKLISRFLTLHRQVKEWRKSGS